MKPKSLMPTPGTLHHIELYVASLDASTKFWEQLLGMLGYTKFQEWKHGVSYKLGPTYIVLVQTEPEFLVPSYHRKRVGLNHIAFYASSRSKVDKITSWVKYSGHRVLYEDRHPFAGGPGHYALYCEDPNQIKVEVVAPLGDPSG